MNKQLEEAINYFRKRIDICLENAEICDENDFDEEATCLRKEQTLIETVLKELERLQEETIEKDKIREKIEELQKEFNRLDEEVEEYLKDKNRNLEKYYENRERIAVMQTIGWTIGKIEELLEGK